MRRLRGLTPSLVKLLIVAEVLAAGPSPEDRALAERAATSSDDAAMSALWIRHDGPALIAAAAARLGLTATGPPDRPGQWGESLMSAQDVATTLARLGEVYGVVLLGDFPATVRGPPRSLPCTARRPPWWPVRERPQARDGMRRGMRRTRSSISVVGRTPSSSASRTRKFS